MENSASKTDAARLAVALVDQADGVGERLVVHGFPASPRRNPWMKFQSSRRPKLHRTCRAFPALFRSISDQQQIISGRP
jgi:hypothetical protein